MLSLVPVINDLRNSRRSLVHHWRSALVMVIVFAIGTGGTIAVGSLVRGVLLAPLPYPHADRLITLGETRPEAESQFFVSSLPNVRDWRAASHTLDAIAAWRDWGLVVRTSAGLQSHRGIIADPGVFDLFSITPVAGRVLAESDDRVDSRVVVVGQTTARAFFGSDQAAVGQTLRVPGPEPGQPDVFLEIVGVVPSGLNLPLAGAVDFIAPLSLDPDNALGRDHRNRQVFARMTDGATLTSVSSEMQSIADRLAATVPS